MENAKKISLAVKDFLSCRYSNFKERNHVPN